MRAQNEATENYTCQSKSQIVGVVGSKTAKLQLSLCRQNVGRHPKMSPARPARDVRGSRVRANSRAVIFCSWGQHTSCSAIYPSGHKTSGQPGYETFSGTNFVRHFGQRGRWVLLSIPTFELAVWSIRTGR